MKMVRSGQWDMMQSRLSKKNCRDLLTNGMFLLILEVILNIAHVAQTFFTPFFHTIFSFHNFIHLVLFVHFGF